MSDGVLSIPTLCTVKQLKEAIIAQHAAFPVTNTANRLVGLIPRRMLIILGRERVFYDQSLIQKDKQPLAAEEEKDAAPSSQQVGKHEEPRRVDNDRNYFQSKVAPIDRE